MSESIELNIMREIDQLLCKLEIKARRRVLDYFMDLAVQDEFSAIVLGEKKEKTTKRGEHDNS